MKVGSGSRVDIELDGAAVSALSRTTSAGDRRGGPTARSAIRARVTSSPCSSTMCRWRARPAPGHHPPDATHGSHGHRRRQHDGRPRLGDLDRRHRGAVSTRVYRSDDDGATYSRVGTPSGLSFRETTLEADATYWWTVEAVDAADNVSPRSEAATATTAWPPVDTASKMGRWTAPFDVGSSACMPRCCTPARCSCSTAPPIANRTAQLWDSVHRSLADVSPPLSLRAQHVLLFSRRSGPTAICS